MGVAASLFLLFFFGFGSPGEGVAFFLFQPLLIRPPRSPPPAAQKFSFPHQHTTHLCPSYCPSILRVESLVRRYRIPELPDHRWVLVCGGGGRGEGLNGFGRVNQRQVCSRVGGGALTEGVGAVRVRVHAARREGLRWPTRVKRSSVEAGLFSAMSVAESGSGGAAGPVELVAAGGAPLDISAGSRGPRPRPCGVKRQ